MKYENNISGNPGTQYSLFDLGTDLDTDFLDNFKNWLASYDSTLNAIDYIYTDSVPAVSTINSCYRPSESGVYSNFIDSDTNPITVPEKYYNYLIIHDGEGFYLSAIRELVDNIYTNDKYGSPVGSEIFTEQGYLNNSGGLSGTTGTAYYYNTGLIKLDNRNIILNFMPVFVAFRSIAFYSAPVLSESNFLGEYPDPSINFSYQGKELTSEDYTFNGTVAKYMILSIRDVDMVNVSLSFTNKLKLDVYSFAARFDIDDLLNRTPLWRNKTIATYGDSITLINNDESLVSWGGIMGDFLKASILPRGIGATSFATQTGAITLDSDGKVDAGGTVPINGIGYCNWERITNMFPVHLKDTVDAVIVMGGTNELYNGLPQGDSDWIPDTTSTPNDTDWVNSSYYSDWNGDFNTSTLRGGICSTVLKLQLWMPQAVIILASPIGGGAYSNNDNYVADGTNGTALPLNVSSGMTQLDISNNIEAMSEYMNVPFIDVWKLAGVSMFNRRWNIRDGVHPYTVTDEAGEVHNNGNNSIAKAMISGMSRISPLKNWFEFADVGYSNFTVVVKDSGDAVIEGVGVDISSANSVFTFNDTTDINGEINITTIYGRLVYAIECVKTGYVTNLSYVEVNANNMTIEIIMLSE